MLRAPGKRLLASKTSPPFNTYEFVTALEKSGFDRKQSEAILNVVKQSLQQSENQLVDAVPVQHFRQVDFAQLKSEIHALERTDFAKLRQENQNLQAEIDKLSQKVREEISRLKAGTRLDLNLERGRLFDDYSELQTKLKEAETKMHQETDQVRANLQQVKFDTLRTLLTTASTLGLVILGYMRLFK